MYIRSHLTQPHRKWLPIFKLMTSETWPTRFFSQKKTRSCQHILSWNETFDGRCGRRWSYTSTRGTFRFLAFHSRFGRLSTLRLLEFWRIWKDGDRDGDIVDGSEIPNNHLGCIKPCKWWEKLPINWCRISAINSIRTCFGGLGLFLEHNTMSSCWIDLNNGSKYCLYFPFPFSFLPKTE